MFAIILWLISSLVQLPDICLLCSKTSTSQRAMVIGLGGLNFFGVIILGTMLRCVSDDVTSYSVVILVCFSNISLMYYLQEYENYTKWVHFICCRYISSTSGMI